MSRGWSIVHFVNVRGGGTASGDQPTAVRPWVAVPGLAGEALEASLAAVPNPTDTDATRKQREIFSAIISVRPLSSMTWLSLAGTRLVSGEAYDSVLRALAMSSLTGTNEGFVMLRRGIFGLVQWELLPPDVRKRVIADLAGPILEAATPDEEIGPAKAVLSGKTSDTRHEIADLLRAEGVLAKDLARMGL
jgi:hypothetical protein